MSDIRKLLDQIEQINESDAGTSTAGSVATVSQPMMTQRRTADEKVNEEVPDYIKAGMNTKGKHWANWAGKDAGIPKKDKLVKDPRKSKLSVQESVELTLSEIEESLKQTLKTTARKLDPTIKDKIFKRGEEQHAQGQKQSQQGNYKGTGKKNMHQGNRLMKLATKELDEARLSEEDIVLSPGKLRSGDVVKRPRDHEIRMAMNDLQASCDNAQLLMGVLGKQDQHQQLPGWVQTLISRANDSLTDVAQYVKGAATRGDQMLEDIPKDRLKSATQSVELTVSIAPIDYVTLLNIQERVGQLDRSGIIDRIINEYELIARPGTSHTIHEGSIKDLDIEYQDYEEMSPTQFRKAYGIDKSEWFKMNKSLLKSALPAYNDLADLPASPTIHEGEGGRWDNIHKKRDRIKKGSGERMRKPGSKGAPSDLNFKAARK